VNKKERVRAEVRDRTWGTGHVQRFTGEQDHKQTYHEPEGGQSRRVDIVM